MSDEMKLLLVAIGGFIVYKMSTGKIQLSGSYDSNGFGTPTNIYEGRTAVRVGTDAAGNPIYQPLLVDICNLPNAEECRKAAGVSTTTSGWHVVKPGDLPASLKAEIDRNFPSTDYLSKLVLRTDKAGYAGQLYWRDKIHGVAGLGNTSSYSNIIDANFQVLQEI